MHFIKKFLKACLTLLIIALVVFSVYRYYLLKKEGKLKDVFAKTEINQDDYNLKVENTKNNTDSKKSSKEDEDKEKQETTNGDKFVVEEKNYDGYYNQFNFDNRLLLYEGKQISEATKEAFNILIEDANDPMYSKPVVVFENFNLTTKQITANNLDEYKYVLNAAKNSVGNGSCTFTFEYNNLKTYVNKIIITKN